MKKKLIISRKITRKIQLTYAYIKKKHQNFIGNNWKVKLNKQMKRSNYWNKKTMNCKMKIRTSRK